MKEKTVTQSAMGPQKLGPALILIMIIAALGIIVYIYTAVTSIGEMSLAAYFPLCMYILMYVSIIQYIRDYFQKGIESSINGMLMRYCALTAASVLTGGTGIGQGLLTCNVMILVLVPLVREDLSNVKKAMVISGIIMVLCIVAAYIKYTANADLMSSNPWTASAGAWAYFAILFDALNPTIQWAIFFALYIIRCRRAAAFLKAQDAAQAEDGDQAKIEAPAATKDDAAAPKN